MNYPYTSIQLIDGEIKAVVNKEAKPIFYKWLTNEDYLIKLVKWQQKHEIFVFANQDEIDKVFYYLTKKLGFKEYETELKQGIEVTCIEIKEGKGWFKEENKHSFENYKNQLDSKCDEQCFYNCSQASSIEPQCLSTESLLIIQLNKWIEDCDNQIIVFEHQEMEGSAISSLAMKTAYNNVKQLIIRK